MVETKPKTERTIVQSKLQKALKVSTLLLAPLATFSGAVAGYWVNSQRDSGHYEVRHPVKPKEFVLGNSLRIVSWNTESEDANPSQDLRRIDRRLHPDIMLGQEVLGGEAKKMMSLFRGYTQVFGVGKNTLDGQAFGNVVMSQQPPETGSIRSRSIDGTNLWQTELRTGLGFVRDAGSLMVGAAIDAGHQIDSSLIPATNLDTSFTYTKGGLQESRDIVAEKFRMEYGLRTINVLAATTHVSGDPVVWPRQMSSVVHFMGKNTAPGQLSVICGDFNNQSPALIRRMFAKYGYITPSKTGENANINGDYCAYADPGLSQISVSLKSKGLLDNPEHRLLELDFKMPTPEIFWRHGIR